MAKGFKAGGGGGTPLNFKVVGGTKPSNPKENTIWVSSPNLLDFNTWANNVEIWSGTKAVSGNSITLTANERDCHTAWQVGYSIAPIPCVAGRTYILEWEHSGADGYVYLFPSGQSDNLVMTSAYARKLELTPADGVTFFTFRVGVMEANTTATYSNIRISEKMAEITGWHFGADEPNVYDIKPISASDPHNLICPHKLSMGDVLNFTITNAVTSLYEYLRISDGYKTYYIRGSAGEVLSMWQAGVKVCIKICNIGGSEVASVQAWDYKHEEGKVWFPVGTSSPVAFNALKKNAIQVCPISAKQYVGGAWVYKEAKSYQNGAWGDWWYYIFQEGVGARVQPTVSKETNAVVTITKDSIYKSGVWATIQFGSFDVTDYNTLCFEVNCTELGSGPNQSIGSAKTAWTANNKRTVYKTDISSMTGSQAISCSGDYAVYTIYNIWLE